MNKTLTHPVFQALAIAGLTLAMIPSVTAAETSSDPGTARFSRSAEGRANAPSDLRQTLQSVPVTEQAELAQEGPRLSPGRAAVSKTGKASSSTAIRSESHESKTFTIFDASSEVFFDLDRDGYFYGLTVVFDADVSDDWADVYAELYLSRNGGPWNLYYTTRDFSIFAADESDAYEVVTELDTGYPTGDYDVLVELYDAASGDFLTDLGPDQDASLAWLPLEDAGLDAPYYGGGGRHGGGGGTGPIALILIALMLAWRQSQRERAALAATGPALRDPV